MTQEEQGFYRSNRDEIIVVAVLAAVVLVIYAQTFGFEFINLDDSVIVFDNSQVLSGLNQNSISWAFTSFLTGNWNPVTWLSLEFDVQMFGANPGRMHAVNVLVHIINSGLAFFIFRRMTGRFRASAIVAILFAVHPAHVESVAWIAERRDVLSTMFWLLTMLAYVEWCKDGAKLWSKYYIATIGLFALGLMTKPMLVTLPFALLLIDVWPLGRVVTGGLAKNIRLVTEKVPLFLLSAALSVVTFYAQRSAGAVQSLEQLSFALRVENTVLAYAKYLGMLFYPRGLAIWYPFNKNIELWQVLVAAVVLIAVTAFCIWQFPRRKYLLIGWLWFGGTLFPVSGIMQVGDQSLADRYTYIPYFGLFIMLAWGVAEIVENFHWDKRVYYSVFGAAAVVLVGLSYVQTAYWVNSETLFRRTLALTKGNYLINHNLCDTLMNAGRFKEAETFCRASLEANPNYYAGYNTIGMMQMKQNQFGDAEANFKKTIEVAPEFAGAYGNLAMAQMFQGRPDEAETNLQKAVALTGSSKPATTFIPVLKDLASAFAAKQNYQKAYENWARILALTPNDLETRLKAAGGLYKLGRFDEAQVNIERVTSANPNNASALNIYGLILLEKKQNDEAAKQFEAALRARPDFSDAKENLQRARGGK